MTVHVSHPEAAQLEAFTRGLLDDETLCSAIATHLDSCPHCQRVLQSLSADTLEQLVRASETAAFADDDDEPVPQRLEHFRIERLLGRGGMGSVYLAEDTRLHRQVAVKTLSAALARKRQAKDRFLREARAAAAVEDDHITPIYYVGEDGGIPFLVMPLLKGLSLGEYLQQAGGKLPPADCVEIARQIALGLSAAYRHGLVHRDIKPSNIWLEAATPVPASSDAASSSTPQPRAFRVKILDFGLAKIIDSGEALTRPGGLLGTPAYMAPEQARGDNVDARADLFSLGCVLYEMLTGRRAFTGPDVIAVLSSLAVDTPAAPHTLNPDVTPELSALVMRLLEKDPARRPASAREVIAALEALDKLMAVEGVAETLALAPADVSKAVAPPETSPQPAPARPWRSRFRWAAAVLLVLAPVGYFFGGTIIRFATNQGELVVEVEDPNVEIKVVQNGVVVQDKTTKREFTLSAGQGTIEVFEKDGVGPLTTKQFALNRGGKTTVRVTWNELADARQPKPQPGEPAESAPASADPDRRAAEYVLSIGGRVEINDVPQEITDVAALPKEPFRLTRVNLLENKQVTDAGLAHFQGCKSLKRLVLDGNPIRGPGLTVLSKLPELTDLSLACPTLTDLGAPHLAGLKQLKRLWLVGANLTDAGLKHLAGLTNLEVLDLRQTKVTAAGIAELQKALPNCRIPWDGDAAASPQ